MTPENYEKLRQKIIEACPELLELSFGCRFLRVEEELIFVCKKDRMWLYIDPEDGRCWEWMNPKKERTTILGHPIRIAHVLRALNTPMNCDYLLDAAGCFWDTSEDEIKVVGPLGDGKIQWNLEQDDLSLQSDEVKMFLFDLLECN